MERFDLELSTLLSVTGENGTQQAFEVTSKNICAGGAFFKTDTPLLVGTKIKMNIIVCIDKLNIDNSNRTYINVLGSVIRIENQGMAVCFGNQYKIENVIE